MSLATELEVRSMQIPSEYKATDTFRPLSHGEVLDLIQNALFACGLDIARDDNGTLRKRFTIIDGGAKMYGTLPLTQRIDNDSRLMVGFANSWNKTLALRLGFGSEVFVCTNGCFFAEKVIGRKHTQNIIDDLPNLIATALSQTKTYVEQQGKFFGRLRDVQLNDKDVSHFVVQSAMKYECITGGEIIDVISEWRTPRFAEFEPRTAWSLHNAYTEVGKRIQAKNGTIHSERMVRMSTMFV